MDGNVKQIRAIVFDDDGDIREFVSEILAARGYEVHSYATPALCPLISDRAGVCASPANCADIIISDMHMPGITGLCFVRNERSGGCRGSNIALMSGSWSDADRKAAHDLGCAVFEKPFSLDEIMRWLDHAEAEVTSRPQQAAQTIVQIARCGKPLCPAGSGRTSCSRKEG